MLDQLSFSAEPSAAYDIPVSLQCLSHANPFLLALVLVLEFSCFRLRGRGRGRGGLASRITSVRHTTTNTPRAGSARGDYASPSPATAGGPPACKAAFCGRTSTADAGAI